MSVCRAHENDPFYGWSPAGSDPADPCSKVPADLVMYYREFKPMHWGYVCPCCKNVWPPGLGGMPGAFRAHIRDYVQGSGCFFNPKTISKEKSR